jgi:hypothetical protein
VGALLGGEPGAGEPLQQQQGGRRVGARGGGGGASGGGASGGKRRNRGTRLEELIEIEQQDESGDEVGGWAGELVARA